MAQNVRNKVEKMQKERDACEENISKLNLDAEMSDEQVEFNMHYFSETSREDSNGSDQTPQSNEKLIGKIKHYVRTKNKICIYLRLKILNQKMILFIPFGCLEAKLS